MVERGYVRQEAPKKGYSLGLAWRGLSQEDPRYQRLIAAAELPMTHMAESVRETVLVAILEGVRRFNLCIVEGDATLQVRRDVITSDDVYRTATGRLLLAHFDDSRLDAFLRAKELPTAQEWPGAESLAGLRRALDAIRREGRVVIRVRGDLVAIGMPIRSGKAVAAALGLYLPAFRFEGEHHERVLVGMKETADAISRSLSEGQSA